MPSSSIQLPAGFGSSILAQANATISGIGEYTNIIIGVILGITVIGILIEFLVHRKG